MAAQLSEMTIRPIGIVRSQVRQKQKPDYNWQEIVSEIVIDDSLGEALDGLEGFSHIIVIYWLHLAVDTAKMAAKVHPRGEPELPLVGRFATRSPYRPNSLGQKVVRLLERRGNVLRVQGLDAVDETPVIDVKPYIPGYDSVDNATVPQWMAKR
ncbi:tRNA (N6-threonylcarbamoyladenosine(37)-N6)-methyltransferase TrmO [Chloroflexota bacterium]